MTIQDVQNRIFAENFKDANDFENYKKALEDEFHKKFIPAIDLIADANENIQKL